MLVLFQRGDARAVGVANYNISHLQEIIDAGLTLPAVNQCPFHLHRSSAQKELVDFCVKHNIVFNSYSPLGIPDLTGNVPKSSSLLLHKFPSPMAANILDEPTVRSMATRYGCTPAQLLLAWIYQQGIPSNPRSYNAVHMRENMDIFNISISAGDMATLGGFPQDYCDLPDNWYECIPRATAAYRRAQSPWDALLG
jgi:diketogulonate reductase-like aldo/keto reductase